MRSLSARSHQNPRHHESGQTFAEYLSADPVRKSDKLHTIYLCLKQRIALASIPPKARRIHPAWGDRQILTGYILHELLEPQRPADALAYLALTSSDLWPGKGWNFVFGEANLRQRIGVWSIYRNGDPHESEVAASLCLRRTLATASHELGHVLTIHHCTAFRCLMNGSNHQEERDQRPMYLCPICLRKLCWNLRAEPVPYLGRLKTFCEQNSLDPERVWYERAIAALTGG